MFKSIREGKTFGAREWILYGMFVAVLVIGAISASRYTAANADYICTKVVDDMSDCSNGSWGAWSVISNANDTQSCVKTTVSQRTYTGTRVSTHTLSYLNLRTACDAGYTQSQVGSGDGNSGFHGGSVVTQTSACQIVQTATTRAALNGGTCASTLQTTTSFDAESTDLNVLDSQTTNINSVADLNAAFTGLSGARLSVIPSLVHAGDTTVVQWKSQAVSACTVTGTNGDTWTALTGKQKSSPITAKTVYTLNCTMPDGSPISESASVDVIPSWQEI